FLLLSLTYLLINYVFGRLSRATGELKERVHELEILNGTARRLASSLQLEELVETVARETCRAIPEAEAGAPGDPPPEGAAGVGLLPRADGGRRGRRRLGDEERQGAADRRSAERRRVARRRRHAGHSLVARRAAVHVRRHRGRDRGAEHARQRVPRRGP